MNEEIVLNQIQSFWSWEEKKIFNWMFNELQDQEISIWIKANRFKMVIKVDRTVVKYSVHARLL